MTFSICVREHRTTDAGDERLQFGAAVTTRRPGVGVRCPFVSEHGAIVSQSVSNPELGQKGVRYLADSLALPDALQALLNADEGAAQRQVHGVDAEATFTFSGEACRDWYGHTSREGVTVAGNLLTGPEVINTTAETYLDSDPSAPLPERLIESLAAGHEAGGDRRNRDIQSAACVVRSSPSTTPPPFAHDLRVDATRSPIKDLRMACKNARRGETEDNQQQRNVR